MDQQAERPSKRRAFLSEVLIVVLGILIAFAVDASYDRFRDRSERTELLQALHAEFQENRSMIADVVEGHTEVTEALVVVLDSVSTFAELGPGASPPLVSSVLPLYTFDPRGGATQAMLNSGQLGLVQDLELRRLLSSWSAVVANLAQDEEHVWDVRDRLRGEMAATGFKLSQEASEDQVVAALDRSALFRNNLFFRLADERRALASSIAVQEHVDSVLTLIEVQLR